jgi:hypothetical protein
MNNNSVVQCLVLIFVVVNNLILQNKSPNYPSGGISSHSGPVLGNLGEGSSTGYFEMDEGGSVDELPPSLFEEAPWRGPGEDFLHWGR